MLSCYRLLHENFILLMRISGYGISSECQARTPMCPLAALGEDCTVRWRDYRQGLQATNHPDPDRTQGKHRL